MPPLSPLAPSHFPVLPSIPGVRLAAGDCGIRYQQRPDLLLAELAEGTTVAGVFTRSLMAAAPVLAAQKSVRQGSARALVVNAGNANAFTGRAGEESLERVRDATCALVGCAPQAFFMASTGVIGETLPDDKITTALPALHARLSADAWQDAAAAILTTDTFPKAVTRRCTIGGAAVTVNGIAKGSGMIAPDMATMLAFLFTDAAITAPALQTLLEETNACSFNCISVDGDTSTSDTALLFATGKAGNPTVSDAADPEIAPFRAALNEAMVELAQLIVKDGEGATKFVTLTVTGAEHDAAARRIALAIANSPLVKTALAAGDANWGRIVAAIGKAGERADRDRLRIDIGGVCVARDGAVNPAYREAMITAHMKGQYIDIAADVGVGSGRAVIWTCDLTHGYIDINGSYRT